MNQVQMQHMEVSHCHDISPARGVNIDFSKFSEREENIIQDVISSQEFKEATNIREQIGLLGKQIRNPENGIFISFRTIGMFFGGLHPTVVQKHLYKYEKGVLPPNRPLSLTEIELHLLHEYIEYNLDKGNDLTTNDILSYIHDNFKKSILKNTFRKLLFQKFPEYKMITGKPVEAPRLQVSPTEIDDYFARLHQKILPIKSAFLFNAHEAGQDDFCDAEEIHLIVRSSFDGNVKSYPVSRDSRRTTVLHYICADGTYIPPLFIEKRDSIDSDVLKFIDPTIASIFPQKKGFMTTDAFD